MVSQEQDLPYRVEMWEDDPDSHVEELIALVADHAVARAAFAEAVKRQIPLGAGDQPRYFKERLDLRWQCRHRALIGGRTKSSGWQ
jgi:hypothetical protein